MSFFQTNAGPKLSGYMRLPEAVFKTMKITDRWCDICKDCLFQELPFAHVLPQREEIGPLCLVEIPSPSTRRSAPGSVLLDFSYRVWGVQHNRPQRRRVVVFFSSREQLTPASSAKQERRSEVDSALGYGDARGGVESCDGRSSRPPSWCWRRVARRVLQLDLSVCDDATALCLTVYSARWRE